MTMGTSSAVSWMQSQNNKALCLNPSGDYIGIGTQIAPVKLTLQDSVDSSKNRIQFNNTDSSGVLLVGLDSSFNATVWNLQNGYLRFGTNNTEHMRCEPNGNVSIKTGKLIVPEGFIGGMEANTADTGMNNALFFNAKNELRYQSGSHWGHAYFSIRTNIAWNAYAYLNF